MMFLTVARRLVTCCNNSNVTEKMLLKLCGHLLYQKAVTMETLLCPSPVTMKIRGLRGAKLQVMKKIYIMYCFGA